MSHFIKPRDIIELDTIDGYSGGEQMWPALYDPVQHAKAVVTPSVVKQTEQEILCLPLTTLLAGWRTKFYYLICNQ